MLYVLNEWVFHDLLSENGGDAFMETGRFLFAFNSSGDRLVIPPQRRWNEKAHRLMRMTDPRGRQISQSFHSLLRDSNRAVRPTPEDSPPISQELQEKTPPEDLYLVLAYVATNADLLITTDEKLHSALAQNDEVNCQLRDEFLTSYPESTGGHR
jgi:hypothetical protein